MITKMRNTIITIVAVLTLIGCNDTKEVESVEPITIDVRLIKGKYINAETDHYKAGDSLIMSLERNSYGYGAKYKLYISKEVDIDAEYVEDRIVSGASVWVEFTDGTKDFFSDTRAFVQGSKFTALILEIEPAHYEGKTIKSIRVTHRHSDRRWNVSINAQEPIGKVLSDMLEACNEFKETQDKYN